MVNNVDFELIWMLSVAEPPKLLRPTCTCHCPLTSDDYAYALDNLRRLSGVLGEPRIIHDFRARSHYRVIAVLQHLFKYLHQSKIAEVLQ